MTRLSEASESRDGVPFGEILDSLRRGDNLCDLARRYRLLTDPDEEAHLRRDWYGEGEPEGRSRWWPDWKVERIVREAYIKVIGLVRDLDLPIAAYWLTGHDEFAAVVVPSRYQVTFALLTPTPQGVSAEAANGPGVTIFDDGGVPRIHPEVLK